MESTLPRALKNIPDSLFSASFIPKSIAGRLAPVLLDLLFFLGPSPVLAVHMSVESYSDLLISGAASGCRMLRVIGVALVYKYCLIEGLSRYTLS